MNFVWATASHKGMIRNLNEDRVFPAGSGRAEGKALVMVADGMGGHVAGEVAAELAVQSASTVEGSVAERVDFGNRAVYEAAARRPELAGMGTTLTLAEFSADGQVRFAHVGDSRAYLYRNDSLRQLTVDHTVVAEHLAAGRISAADVSGHPQRSMLTRALGLDPEIEVDTFTEPLAVGDRFLLCSDGVTSMITDDDLAYALAAQSPEEAAWLLVELSNRAGGHDNITAVVVDVLP